MTHKDNPPTVERMYVSCFPRREYHVFSAWAEMLRYDESHVVQGGSENLSEALSRTAWCYHPPAALSTSICDNLLSIKQSENSSHDNVVDRIMCLVSGFAARKKTCVFGQSCSVRDGLKNNLVPQVAANRHQGPGLQFFPRSSTSQFDLSGQGRAFCLDPPCLNLVRPCGTGRNGTRLFMVVRSVPS